MSEIQSAYNYKVVRQFTVMAVIWGIVGMLVGVIIAAQLVWPELNLGFLHFGRLRPLHTNAVIFAFGGCALMGSSFYVVQRTCNVRLFGGNIRAFFAGIRLRVQNDKAHVAHRKAAGRLKQAGIAHAAGQIRLHFENGIVHVAACFVIAGHKSGEVCRIVISEGLEHEPPLGQ